MTQFRAAWILPISEPPIRNGWIRVGRGRIVALGRHRGEEHTPEIDLGAVAVLPGLVNAHTHLELSWMRGRIPETERFSEWIRSVMTLRSDQDAAALVQPAMVQAIAEVRRCGTVLVGDISNTLASAAPLTASGLAAVVFRELIGFRGQNAARLVEEACRQMDALPAADSIRYSLAAHAPYSVSPLLFQAIKSALSRDPFSRCSVHLGESVDEVQFLEDGTGAWRTLLDDLDVWDPAWVPPESDPVEYLDRMGFLDARLLVVHGVQLRPPALECLAKHGATLVTCPRGNLRTGAGTPPISTFYKSGVRVAVGTDSLASVPDLNLFSELTELHRLAPDVPASALLESATINGARALGFDADFGTIEAGKRAALIAVQIHPTEHPEAQLIGGIVPSQISHLDTA